jgi:hypothetical protein
VPAGVPDDGVPLTAAEHPDPSTTNSTANPSTKRACRRLPATRPSSTSVAIAHSILVSSMCARSAGGRPGKILLGCGHSMPRAVVVTIRFAVEALDPFRVTEFGEIVQVPACNAPPQAKLTA